MASTTTIRIDDGVKEEATRIADQLGMSFNMVVNILLHKFNADKGFAFPVRLPDTDKSVFDMTSDDFEQACKAAVANRQPNPTMPYTTRIDETGRIVKKYADGRVEYVVL